MYKNTTIPTRDIAFSIIGKKGVIDVRIARIEKIFSIIKIEANSKRPIVKGTLTFL
ncbi:MAG: hypothetical protein ACRCVG_06885 [Methanobacteriaceae archaeon]